MVQIITNFNLFTEKQKVLVYSNGDIIDDVDVNIDDLVNVIKGFKNKYGAEDITLIGDNNYLSKFKRDLSTDFSATKINIVQR